MTKKVKILLPPLGEGIIEATLIQWLKKIGDSVEFEEPIAEIATDKVDTEILAPAKGVLDRIFFKEGDTPKVGNLLAAMNVEDSVGVPQHLLLTSENVEKKFIEKSNYVTEAKQDEPIFSHEIILENQNKETEPWLSPLVKSIINEEGISNTELHSIKGTGKNNRITKNDIMSFLKNRNEFAHNKETKEKIVEKTSITSSVLDDVIPMSRMRTIIAERMVQSVATSPHVTSFVETDVTNLVQWREKNKAAFEMKYGEKLTYTPLFAEAIIVAIKQFPLINVSVGNNEIYVHKQINIGMATALPSGDLIVPVIKTADEKNILGLTRTINDLALRARTNQLKHDEIKGGTFTFTNVGTFNNITGTPIINQPEVAILAIGAIKKRPAVIETPQGDTIGIRHQIILALSYDHRVVDGALGGMFLAKVGELLENFDTERKV